MWNNYLVQQKYLMKDKSYFNDHTYLFGKFILLLNYIF